MVVTRRDPAVRSTAGPDAPGRGAIPVVVPLPRRAGRFAWRFQDCAHGLLLGLLAPVIVAPVLLLGEVDRSAAIWSVVIAYVAWLAIVAKFAVGFARARERAALVAFLVISCFFAAIAVPALVTLYAALMASVAAGAGR